MTFGLGVEERDFTLGAKTKLGGLTAAFHVTKWEDEVESGYGTSADHSLAVQLTYKTGNLEMSYQGESLDSQLKSQVDVSYDLGGGTSVKFRSRADDLKSAEYT